MPSIGKGVSRMCCVSKECLSGLIDVVSLSVSVIAIIVAYKTQKRYLAGNVQIVKEALNPIVLEQVADIIAEVRKKPNGQDNVALMLYLNGNGKSAVVNKVFQDLDMVCALIHDNALPRKVIARAKESIKHFVSRVQILEFVKCQKDMYLELYRLANELNPSLKQEGETK